MANPAVPGVAFHDRRFNQIMEDINDARVYGGIHFRFDQDAGADRDAASRRISTSTTCAARSIAAKTETTTVTTSAMAGIAIEHE